MMMKNVEEQKALEENVSQDRKVLSKNLLAHRMKHMWFQQQEYLKENQAKMFMPQDMIKWQKKHAWTI